MKKVLSVFLAIVVVVSTMPILEVSATSRTQAEAIVWINSQIGAYTSIVNGNKVYDEDNSFGTQCVDLIRFYYRWLGATPVTGHAYQYETNHLPSIFTRLSKSQIGGNSGIRPGDIIVQGRGVGDAHRDTGHVSIAVAVNGNSVDIVHSSPGIIPRPANNAVTDFTCVIRPNFVGGSSTNSLTSIDIPNGTYIICYSCVKC